MRIIDNKSLLTMTSPIKYVMKFLHTSLINIAPERTNEFDEIYSSFTITYIDSPKWICNVDPKTKVISLSRRVVEVVWCASYAYMVFYIKEIQGKELSDSREIDLHRDAEVSQGINLLTWVYKNWLNEEDTPWPKDLPMPKKNIEKGSFHNVADELCLCSMAYILHHELAHISLKHDALSINSNDERNADYTAADWIMHPSLQEDDQKFIKRALGIAIAQEILTSYGIYTGKFNDEKHPPSYDRLIHTLQRFINDNNHIVWSVVITSLTLHLDNSGITKPNNIYDSFLECAEDYANTLANQRVDFTVKTPVK